MGVLVAVVASTLIGCSPTPKKFDVEVTLDPDLKSYTVPVDIIGVNNDANLPKWTAQDVGKYFSAGSDQRRSSGAYTMDFREGSADRMTLSAGDKKWTDWNDPTSIVIFAQIPHYTGDTGGGDQRRKVLATMSDTWAEDKLRIVVHKSGMEVLTPQKKK